MIVNVKGFMVGERRAMGNHRGLPLHISYQNSLRTLRSLRLKSSLLRALRVLRGENFFTGKPEDPFLFDHQQHGAAFDGVSRLYFNFFDLAGNRAMDFVFHLHRFDNHQALALFDLIALRN